MQYSMTVCGDAAMQEVGRQVASAIRSSTMRVRTVFLRGDLGVGKTTLVKGLVAGFGISDPVTSPTFTLVESYEFTDGSLFHFDLYRLESADELEHIGLRDMLAPDNVCVFEWPERAEGLLRAADLEIEIDFAPQDAGGRECRVLNANLPIENVAENATANLPQ